MWCDSDYCLCPKATNEIQERGESRVLLTHAQRFPDSIPDDLPAEGLVWAECDSVLMYVSAGVDYCF